MADAGFWNGEVIATYGRMLSDDEHIEHMNHLLQEAVTAGGIGNSGYLYVVIAFILGLIIAGVVAWK